MRAVASGEIDGWIVSSLSITRIDLPAGNPMALGLRCGDSLSQAYIEQILVTMRDDGSVDQVERPGR